MNFATNCEKDNILNIRPLVDELLEPKSQRIILKIDGFQLTVSCRSNSSQEDWETPQANELF